MSKGTWEHSIEVLVEADGGRHLHAITIFEAEDKRKALERAGRSALLNHGDPQAVVRYTHHKWKRRSG